MQARHRLPVVPVAANRELVIFSYLHIASHRSLLLASVLCNTWGCLLSGASVEHAIGQSLESVSSSKLKPIHHSGFQDLSPSSTSLFTMRQSLALHLHLRFGTIHSRPLEADKADSTSVGTIVDTWFTWHSVPESCRTFDAMLLDWR